MKDAAYTGLILFMCAFALGFLVGMIRAVIEDCRGLRRDRRAADVLEKRMRQLERQRRDRGSHE